MKSKLTLLFLLILNFNFCFAEEVVKLPEIPWRAIVETQNEPPYVYKKWDVDISIRLFDNYSKTDSLMVVKAISELNKLTETIHIRLSQQDLGNLELHFIDSTHDSTGKQITTLSRNQRSNYTITTRSQGNSMVFFQYINMKLVPDDSKQNFLTNTMAFILYPNYWRDNQYDAKIQRNEETNESIFRSIANYDRDVLFFTEMQEFDKKLLKEVYSRDFEKNLKIAQKQFKPLIPYWLKVNPYVFLLFPFLLLSLIVLAIYIQISKRTINHISNKLLRFNINGLILGLFFAIIASFYFSLSADIYYDLSNLAQLRQNLTAGAFLIFIVGLPTINLLRFLEIIIQRNTHRKLMHVALIFLTTGLIPFSFILAFFYFPKNRRLYEFEIGILAYLLIACLVVATFRALISYFIFKEKELIIENETKLSTLRELKTKAEMNALHSRINPHFLYNSLNSIAGLAHDDADKTEHMALSLSKLFRYSINKDQSDWTTFQEELEMVKIYLDVEKVRFDDRLSYSVDLPKELENYKIPRFIIQPLVENAVKHGISKSVESGQIKVVVTQEGHKVFIAVSDDGPAFPNDLAPGFGIQSIYDKLEILYKGKFEMNFINSPQKQVLIKLN